MRNRWTRTDDKNNVASLQEEGKTLELGKRYLLSGKITWMENNGPVFRQHSITAAFAE